jgi:hypothetical protein
VCRWLWFLDASIQIKSQLILTGCSLQPALPPPRLCHRMSRVSLPSHPHNRVATSIARPTKSCPVLHVCKFSICRVVNGLQKACCKRVLAFVALGSFGAFVLPTARLLLLFVAQCLPACWLEQQRLAGESVVAVSRVIASTPEPHHLPRRAADRLINRLTVTVLVRRCGVSASTCVLVACA